MHAPRPLLHLSAAALLLLAVNVGQAATYYVRPDGSDGNAGTGSAPGQAWQTLSQALTGGTVLQPGDTVHIMTGTYFGPSNIFRNGASGNFIRIVGDTDGSVFGGAGGPVVVEGNDPLQISGNYLEFESLEIHCTNSFGTCIGVSNENIIRFRRCVIHGGNIGIYLFLDSNVHLYNCLVYDTVNHGVYVDGSSPSLGNLTVWNSTIVGSSGGRGITLFDGVLLLRNSILADNGQYGLVVAGSSFVTHTHNLFYNNGIGDLFGTSASTGELFVDPLFVGGGDYRVQTGSPAINSGTSGTSLGTVDLLGVTRPQDGAWDMGCYEGAAAGIAPSGPEGHWKYDEVSGAAVFDSSGNGNHGALVDGITREPNGRIGGAITLNEGITDRIEKPSGVVDGASDLTFLAWFRTSDTTGTPALISGANSGNANEFLVVLQAGGTEVRVFTGETGGTFNDFTLPYTVADGEWRHIAVVRDDANDELSVYLDGELVGTQSATLNTLQIDGGGLFLGEDQDVVGGGFQSSNAFDGSIDDVRIYRRALSADEITVIFTGLIGHWKLDDGSGSTAVDSTPIGTDLTATSTPTWVAAVRGGGVDLTGNRLDSPGGLADRISGEFSAACWFRPATAVSGFGANTTFLHHMRGSNTGFDLFFLRSSEELRLRTNDGSSSTILTWDASGLRPDRWVHIAASYDGAEMRIYIDGQLAASRANTDGLVMGGEALTFASGLDGDFDDVRLYDRALTGQEVTELHGLVGHYRLDEASGTTAADSAGIGGELDAVGAVTWQSAIRSNGAYQTDAGRLESEDGVFDGVDEAVSFALWFRLEGPISSVSPANILVDMLSGGFAQGAGLQFNPVSNEVQFPVYDGSAVTHLRWDASSIDDQRWHQAAAVYDGAEMRLYVDGQLVETLANTNGLAADVSRFRLGVGLDVSVDDVQVYNRAMTDHEIAEHYGLVGHYKLDEPSGSIAVDSSGLGNHGVYMGAPTLGVAGARSRLGDAVELDGASYVEVSHRFGTPRSVTISAWASLDTPDTYGAELASLGHSLAIRLDDQFNNFGSGAVGTMAFYLLANSGNSTSDFGFTYPTPSQNYAGAGWSLFTAVYDEHDGVLELYVDEALVSSVSAPDPIDWTGLGTTFRVGRIGRGPVPGSSFENAFDFSGSVDDVRVYNRALTPEEVRFLYYGDATPGVPVLRWVEVP